MQRGDYALEKSDGSKIPRDRTPSFRVFLEAPSYTDVTYLFVTRRNTLCNFPVSLARCNNLSSAKKNVRISKCERRDLRNILQRVHLCSMHNSRDSACILADKAVHRAEEKKSA